MSIPPEAYGFFKKHIDKSYSIEGAWGLFPEGAFTQILVQVRSRFLDFMLQLSDKFPTDPNQKSIRQLSKEINVNEIFRGAVFGDGAILNLAIGSNNSAIQNVEQKIIKDDFESLAKALQSYQVSEYDIQELQAAVISDENSEEHASGNYGSKVRAWLGGMVAKAGTTAWSISTQTAAGVLAGALSKYYGFS